MGIPGDPFNGGTVVLYHVKPYFFLDIILLHSPYIDLTYGRYLQSRFLKWPLTESKIK